jgi:hypothetical protein
MEFRIEEIEVLRRFDSWAEIRRIEIRLLGLEMWKRG